MLYNKVRNSRALKKKAVSPTPSAPPPLPPVPIESPAQAERSELRKQIDARVFSFDTISEEDVPEIPALPVDPSRPSLVQKPRKQPQVAVEIPVLRAAPALESASGEAGPGGERELLRAQLKTQRFDDL